MKLNKPEDKYTIVKGGKKYKVCKIISEHDTEEDAVDWMLDHMNKEFKEKQKNK